MKKLNKNAVKYLVCSALGVLIIIYFIYQIVQMNFNPYKTELAVQRNFEKVVSATAFVVRDESVISAENSKGTVVSVAEDGKRVSSGETVAVVFQSADSAAAYTAINELEKEIAYCRQLKNRVGLGTNSPSSYNEMINDACLSFIKTARNGISASFDEALIDLRDAVTARQLAVGENISVDERLATLEGELAALKGRATGFSTVASPNSGYYIGSVDGYETAIDYKEAEKANCEVIDSLLNYTRKENTGNTMGKLVDEFNWYFLCTVPYNDSGELKIGDSVTVNVPDTSVGSITCTVAQKGAKEGDRVALVLKCNTMNRNVANLRIEKIEIVIKSYQGMRISNVSIREQEGEKGVFVVRGNMVQFKKINIVESGENYSTVEIVDDSDYLKQYDTVITEGVNLYDGKIVS